ncbi:hypothetical protein BD626DRAFT_636395 [Schizophyllum amplum]|uniref:Uncharacterized protein n=1 Tax=Schizophyllum amplum TaxID=97359 RepID=A0A550BTC2_9AGAR|nr:hypothetical protein BD626DRAFT_636395 [Auriculariopsis ampla]
MAKGSSTGGQGKSAKSADPSSRTSRAAKDTNAKNKTAAKSRVNDAKAASKSSTHKHARRGSSDDGSSSEDEQVELVKAKPRPRKDQATKSASSTSRAGRKSASVEDESSKEDVEEPEGEVSEHEEGSGESTDEEEASSDDDLASLRRKLAKSNSLVRKLRENPDSGHAGTAHSSSTPKIIDRPRGTFSIQIAMGLGGDRESKKYHEYLSIQRRIKQIVIQAQVPWEKTWANIPEEDKAKVYRVARLQIPFLARFRNDWATAAIARQYCSNLRADAYRRGELGGGPEVGVSQGERREAQVRLASQARVHRGRGG